MDIDLEQLKILLTNAERAKILYDLSKLKDNKAANEDK